MEIEKYIEERNKCPLCESNKISEGISPNVDLEFPVLPVCVDTPKENDEFFPFTIGICENCGLIQLKKVVDPEFLYKIFHSDGIGRVWEDHYTQFAELIKKHRPDGKILEIGAGQGKLVNKLKEIYHSNIEVLDPQYEGPKEGVIIHEGLLTNDSAKNLGNKFDAVISSHTLEHFLKFKDYFTASWNLLNDGGYLFTSVPNQELGFLRGYGNMLNPEHPSVCTNAHWIALHEQNGFRIKEISFYKDHSVQIAAQKSNKNKNFEINVKGLSEKILEQYNSNINNRIDTVKRFARDDKENWVFGASNFTQPLFVYGLDESIFKGVLDNSPLKHNKRLYGTNLICKKPEDIINKNSNIRVFLNLAHYNNEVYDQLKNLNNDLEIIFL